MPHVVPSVSSRLDHQVWHSWLGPHSSQQAACPDDWGGPAPGLFGGTEITTHTHTHTHTHTCTRMHARAHPGLHLLSHQKGRGRQSQRGSCPQGLQVEGLNERDTGALFFCRTGNPRTGQSASRAPNQKEPIPEKPRAEDTAYPGRQPTVDTAYPGALPCAVLPPCCRARRPNRWLINEQTRRDPEVTPRKDQSNVPVPYRLRDS